MTSPALTNTPNRSPEQAREELHRKDMAGWFGARHASDDFGILSRNGREVCRCDYEPDRDAILRIARAHDALVKALEQALHCIENDGWSDGPYLRDTCRRIENALALAKGKENV